MRLKRDGGSCVRDGISGGLTIRRMRTGPETDGGRVASYLTGNRPSPGIQLSIRASDPGSIAAQDGPSGSVLFQ